MRFIDKTVPVTCAECREQCDGIENILSHILVFHQDYSSDEAKKYARIWTDDAYEEIQRQEQDYGEARRREDSDD